MRVALTRFALAAMIAGAAIPASGAGMPDFGTKNFNPGADAPSYFSNENAAIGPASGEAMDDGGDDAPIRPMTTAEPRGTASASLRHHGRFSASQRSGSHRVAYARSSGHAHWASARGGRTEASGRGRPREGSAREARYRSSTTGNAKPMRSARHVAARSSSRRG